MAITEVNVVHDVALATETVKVISFHETNQYRVVQAAQDTKIFVVHDDEDVEAMIVI